MTNDDRPVPPATPAEDDDEGEWKVVYDGPSRPMITNGSTARSLLFALTPIQRWPEGFDEDALADRIASALNAVRPAPATEAVLAGDLPEFPDPCEEDTAETIEHALRGMVNDHARADLGRECESCAHYLDVLLAKVRAEPARPEAVPQDQDVEAADTSRASRWYDSLNDVERRDLERWPWMAYARGLRAGRADERRLSVRGGEGLREKLREEAERYDRVVGPSNPRPWHTFVSGAEWALRNLPSASEQRYSEASEVPGYDDVIDYVAVIEQEGFDRAMLAIANAPAARAAVEDDAEARAENFVVEHDDADKAAFEYVRKNRAEGREMSPWTVIDYTDGYRAAARAAAVPEGLREALVADVFGTGNEPDPQFAANLDALIAGVASEARAALADLEGKARAYETAIHFADVDEVNAAQRALDESRVRALLVQSPALVDEGERSG